MFYPGDKQQVQEFSHFLHAHGPRFLVRQLGKGNPSSRVTQPGIDLSGILGFLQSIYDVLIAIRDFILGIVSTIFQAISNAWVGSNNTINWEPLKVSGALFTNKFPFSLPCDLQRMISGFSTSAVTPTFTINIDAGIFQWKQEQDFSLFNPIIPTVRALLLIGLILVWSTGPCVGWGVGLNYLHEH